MLLFDFPLFMLGHDFGGRCYNEESLEPQRCSTLTSSWLILELGIIEHRSVWLSEGKKEIERIVCVGFYKLLSVIDQLRRKGWQIDWLFNVCRIAVQETPSALRMSIVSLQKTTVINILWHINNKIKHLRSLISLPGLQIELIQ